MKGLLIYVPLPIFTVMGLCDVTALYLQLWDFIHVICLCDCIFSHRTFESEYLTLFTAMRLHRPDIGDYFAIMRSICVT